VEIYDSVSRIKVISLQITVKIWGKSKVMVAGSKTVKIALISLVVISA
jgi:hypothetical protein